MSPDTHPINVCWVQHGSPAPRDIDEFGGGTGTCALCRRLHDQTWPVSAVVSDNSTIWDDLSQDGRPALLCTPCAWGFRMEAARKVAFLIEEADCIALTFEEAGLLLLAPLTGDRALSIPISGRKHTLPLTTWGKVSSDYGAFRWEESEAALANAVFRLRKVGARWRDLANAQPGMTDPSSDWQACFADWADVQAWRGTPQLALTCSSLRKGGVAPTGDVRP